mgnify:FL=1|tara:strand:+ start:68 stop:658 length:591 start_codon:yes stop_codon:yes gene_type:complete
MKKIVLALFTIFALSCDDDCTSTYDVYEYVGEQRSSNEGVLVVTEDMCVESLPVYFSIIIRNDATLTVYGENLDVDIEGTLVFNDGGTLNVSNSLNVGTNIFFKGDGSLSTINVEKAIVADEANADPGVPAVINYGLFASIPTIYRDVTINEVTDLEIESCQTLAVNDIEGYRYLGRIDYKCNMKDTPEFKYIEVN